MKEGLFIVIYGINNLGKTTQAEMLVDALETSGLKSEHLKYPIYDLKPTGPKINEILRNQDKQQISEEEFQKIYIQNRRDFQPELCRKISEGINIVAEDYIGSGLAWGMTKGADLERMLELNKGLVKPDMEILLDGERFLAGKEENHQHESNDQLMEKSRQSYIELDSRFNWQVVDANQSIEEVHQDILKIIENKVKEISE